MKKYYWLSYAMCHDNGVVAFGNGYYGVDDKYLDTRSIGLGICQSLGARHVTILFWKEVAESDFDLSLARDATFLELEQKHKEKEKS